MTFRKVPGALALGLLASLVAHSALYGGEHAMAGGYHALLLEGTLTAIFGLALGFTWLAASGLGSADGTILAARLRDRLPPLPFLALSASLWFGLSEAVESQHGVAAPLATIACLLVASWIVLRVARAGLAALARAVIAIVRPNFSPRTPDWVRPRPRPPVRREVSYSRRLFTRPPPIATTVRA